MQVSFEILPGQAAVMTNIKEKNPSNVSNKTCTNPVLCFSSRDFKLMHEYFVDSFTVMQYSTDFNYSRELEHNLCKYKMNSKYVIPRRGCVERYASGNMWFNSAQGQRIGPLLTPERSWNSSFSHSKLTTDALS